MLIELVIALLCMNQSGCSSELVIAVLYMNQCVPDHNGIRSYYVALGVPNASTVMLDVPNAATSSEFPYNVQICSLVSCRAFKTMHSDI